MRSTGITKLGSEVLSCKTGYHAMYATNDTVYEPKSPYDKKKKSEEEFTKINTRVYI